MVRFFHKARPAISWGKDHTALVGPVGPTDRFLPSVFPWGKLGFSFCLEGPFELIASRGDIHEGSRRNQVPLVGWLAWLMQEIIDAGWVVCWLAWLVGLVGWLVGLVGWLAWKKIWSVRRESSKIWRPLEAMSFLSDKIDKNLESETFILSIFVDYRWFVSIGWFQFFTSENGWFHQTSILNLVVEASRRSFICGWGV